MKKNDFWDTIRTCFLWCSRLGGKTAFGKASDISNLYESITIMRYGEEKGDTSVNNQKHLLIVL